MCPQIGDLRLGIWDLEFEILSLGFETWDLKAKHCYKIYFGGISGLV